MSIVLYPPVNPVPLDRMAVRENQIWVSQPKSGIIGHGGVYDYDAYGESTVFEIEVECHGQLTPNDRGGMTCDGGCQDPPYGVITHRVKVVVILDAFDQCPEYKPADHICHCYADTHWYWHRGDQNAGPLWENAWTEKQVVLPEATEPGDIVVLLELVGN